jgi:LuxR family transcriptional regulator, maltose regulon positive regulatory protein
LSDRRNELRSWDVAEVQEVPILGSGAVLAATKLHIPAVRPELIARAALVEELASRPRRNLALVEAPAGYGKTTLIAEWCSSTREDRGFAWLSLDEGDSDPVRFLAGVIDALRTVEPGMGAAALDALESRSVRVRDVALPLLLNELAGLERDVVLVLDDYQTVRGEGVHGVVEVLLDHLPDGLQVVIGTRVDPPLSLARRRARGQLTELRAADLRLTPAEAAELLRRTVGLDVSDDEVSRLHERTEGWPAGLYLAGLSLRGRADRHRFIESFAGDDRHIVDYLASEVLGEQPEHVRTFLLKTSLLERLCGPLCDAVTGSSDSARLLERVESQNLFLIPLDTTRTWYRYHRLFGELLRHELELSDRDAAWELHRSACDWYRQQDLIPDAIRHATLAGDVDEARELINAHWNDYFNRGRLATVEQWLAAIPTQSVRSDPRLCVAGAWLALDRGALEDARGWIESAVQATQAGGAGWDPQAVAADIGVLRAVHGFKVAELESARVAAQDVLELADEGTFPHTVARLILGVTLYWQGEPAEAAEVLRDAADAAAADENLLGQSYALGYLGLVEIDRGAPDEADRLGKEALGLSDSPGFREHFVLMLAHLARGRAAKLDGRLEDAEAEIRRGVEIADRGAGRLEVAAALLALARIRHLRGDPAEARDAILKAQDVIDRCPETGTLGRAVAAAHTGFKVAAPGVGHPSAGPAEELTDRELAVLRLLPSPLSRREIAEALYVSPNTIKTHAKGIYRKLDAASREDAVSRARELGIL